MASTPAYSPEKNYPTGKIASMGDNLRLIARDKSSYKLPLIEPGSMPALDAIAIPTARDSRQTSGLVAKAFNLVRKHKAGIVIFICSGGTKKEDIAKVALRYPEQSWLAIDWQQFGGYKDPQFVTTDSHLARGKNFNANEKRNFILQLARLMSWRSILFLDDDIEIAPSQVTKAAYLLDSGSEVVGFNVRDYPDHSVAVHANQLVNDPIDSFIGTGAMAIRTDKPFLSFFPNSYNNDWLFSVLHSLAGEGSLVWAGMVKQKPFNPFVSTKRAEREEPGDLLAEGLFRLVIDLKSRRKPPKTVDEGLGLIAAKADEAFWEKEITSRLDFIQRTTELIKGKPLMRGRRSMLRSLRASADVINGHEGTLGISAKDCVKWINGWIDDVHKWNEHLAGLKPANNLENALATLSYESNYIHGNARPAYGPVVKIKPHALYDFLDNAGKDSLTEALLGRDSREFIQNTTAVRSNNLIRLVRGADKLRHDRPLADIGVKPAMTVIMFVRLGEHLETIKKSVRALADKSSLQAPLQLVVWVYPESNESAHQLNRFRNIVVSEIIPGIQGTGMMLLSGTARESGHVTGIDNMVRETSENMLLAYWKLGRRPMPDHRFVVINSTNKPLRFGTITQLIRGEHVIPDKSLSAYLNQYRSLRADKAALPARDKREVTQARERLSRGLTWSDSRLASYMLLMPTLSLMWAKARAGLSLRQVDDLAYTMSIHHSRGWYSIQNVDKVLCVNVEYMQALPGDIFAAARRIAAASKRQLKDTDAKSCMVIITGEPDVPWEDLQYFRESLMDVLTGTQGVSNTVYVSLIYRRQTNEKPARVRKVTRALARYIYWLENHNSRQRYIWYSISKSKYEL